GGTPALRRRVTVERRSLPRTATVQADQLLHRLGLELLTVLGPRRAGDRLVHQRPAQIVDAGAERCTDSFGSQLDPGRLDVRDPWMQREARHGVQDVRLVVSMHRRRLYTELMPTLMLPYRCM